MPTMQEMQGYLEEAKILAKQTVPSGGGYFGEGLPGRFIIALHMMVLERLEKLTEKIGEIEEKQPRLVDEIEERIGHGHRTINPRLSDYHLPPMSPVATQNLLDLTPLTSPNRLVRLVDKPCLDCGELMIQVPSATKRCSKCKEAKKKESGN